MNIKIKPKQNKTDSIQKKQKRKKNKMEEQIKKLPIK